jgi:hypothetical protein
MEDYTINVTKIEELQTISNTDELETIFIRAKSAVVNGAKVMLVREESTGAKHKFDEIDTLDDLEAIPGAGVSVLIKRAPKNAALFYRL